jgi:hypothetical protein
MKYRFDSRSVILLAAFALQCGGEVSGGSGDFAAGGTAFIQGSTVTGTALTPATSTLPTTGGANSINPITGYGGVGSTSVSIATGGTAIGTPIVPAPTCTPELNLLKGDLGPNGNWIGGEPSSTVDNPCGVQGLIYVFGDTGLDNTPGTADDTCPFLNPTVSPCKNGRCCVSGATRLWPGDSWGQLDYAAPIWGCGIGISLNDPQNGSGTLPYVGPAKGFTLFLDGSTTGQYLRIGYTQIGATSKAPFAEVFALGTHTVEFRGIWCPKTYSIPYDGCIDPGLHPHALQVWIVGGDTMGPFELCISGVYPAF